MHQTIIRKYYFIYFLSLEIWSYNKYIYHLPLTTYHLPLTTYHFSFLLRKNTWTHLHIKLFPQKKLHSSDFASGHIASEEYTFAYSNVPSKHSNLNFSLKYPHSQNPINVIFLSSTCPTIKIYDSQLTLSNPFAF